MSRIWPDKSRGGDGALKAEGKAEEFSKGGAIVCRIMVAKAGDNRGNSAKPVCRGTGEAIRKKQSRL